MTREPPPGRPTAPGLPSPGTATCTPRTKTAPELDNYPKVRCATVVATTSQPALPMVRRSCSGGMKSLLRPGTPLRLVRSQRRWHRRKKATREPCSQHLHEDIFGLVARWHQSALHLRLRGRIRLLRSQRRCYRPEKANGYYWVAYFWTGPMTPRGLPMATR